MKNINIKSFLLLAGVVGMTACSENAWNDKLDGFKEPSVYDKTETVEYTLTAADYKTIASNSTNKSLAETAGESQLLAAIGNNGYFPTSEAARKYLPAFVADSKFPYFTLNNGSTVRMTYNIDNGLNEEVVAINNGVKQYTVSESDYQEVYGSAEDFAAAFSPSHPASEYLPGILAQKYPNAVAGDYAVVSYSSSDSDPVFGSEETPETPTPAFEESDVLGSVAKDQNIEVNGVVTGICKQGFILTDKGGSILVYFGNSFDMSAYALGDRLEVSGTVSSYNKGFQLPSSSTIKKVGTQTVEYPAPTVVTGADMDQAITRTTDATAQYVQFTGKLSISGNYYNVAVDGATTATGSLYQFPANLFEGIENDGTYVFKGYFTSISNSGGAPKFYNLLVTEITAAGAAAPKKAATIPATGHYAIYKYDGTAWKVPGSMTILQPSDYAAMGQSYGNLSGTLPDQLLPTYLDQVLPYASDDAAEFVVYKYYDSPSKVTTYQAREYTKISGVWVYDNGIIPVTEKFSRKDNKWEFNPSVEMVLPYARNTDPSYTYYMAVKDWVFANVTKKLYPDAEPANGSQPGPAFIDYRDNAEFWSGASAYYGNVDVRASTAKTNAPEGYTGYDGLSDDEISALILKRFATESFPGALSIVDGEAQLVDGMDVTYTFTFTAYTSDGTQEYVAEYLLIGKGSFQFTSLWKLNDGVREEVKL